MKHTIQELKLANGAQGLLVDAPDSTVVGAELNFRAGDYLSPKGKWEVAHILEHMVLGANQHYPKARLFQAELQKNGAYANASTGAYNLNYITECAAFESQRVLELLAHSIETPLLPENEFKAETGNVREELTGDLNHHFRQLLILSREKFGLVAKDDAERLGMLDNIKLEDIRHHYKKTHTSDNLRFIVAGNISERQKEIEELFNNLHLERGERIQLPSEAPHSYRGPFVIERPGLSNLYFLWHTFTHRELEPAEEDAISLVNVMLTATLHSRILGEARERGLAYDIASQYGKSSGLSDLWFGAEILPSNAEPVFDIIIKELRRILNGTIDDKDVEAARQYSLGRYQRGVQSLRGLMAGYSSPYFFNGRINDYYDVPNRLNAVTKQQMIDVVQTMFADRTWGLTVLGTNKQELAEKLNHKLAVLWN